ncbi:tyrosine-type recombinase/integrase [Paenibacillus chitinolyticus]|uniref:site-specific integrase n=1 Tax=Paenibacillus chitinolyticus TaxID=79263 RepID=UPI001C47F02D|nr:site-specific integrase [Paenibacillus chitinolyticus]
MASIFKNGKTEKWEFVFDYYKDGKRRQVRRRGFKTKREASEHMVDLQKAVRDQAYIEPCRMTIDDFLAYWLQHIRKFQCEETTYYNNRLYVKNHIRPRIGSIKLQCLDDHTCQQFVNDMHRDGFARNTIDRVVSVLKQSLDKAVDLKLMKQNPMRKVALPRAVRKEAAVWTVEQANTFLRKTRNSRYHCAYSLALLTGMRQGEILGLRWKDIHFGKKILTVNQRLTNYGKSIKSGAKTSAGVRTISLPDRLIQVLNKQREHYERVKKERGSRFIDMDLVIFNLTNGKTVYPSNLTKRYKQDVSLAGLPHIPFHSMRHTHATMLIEQNIHVKLISERLGHSKIGVTLDIYSHVSPSMQREVADRINAILNP